MNLFEFMSDSPWLAFFLAVLCVQLLWKSVYACVNGLNRIVRHFNIRKCGWPPAHCDADGDAVEDSDKAEELRKLISDVADSADDAWCEFSVVVGGPELNALFRAAGLDARVGQQEK